MHFFKVFTLFQLLLVVSLSGIAQTDFDSTITHLRKLSVQGNDDRTKTEYSDSLRQAVRDFLDSEKSFDHPLVNIPYLGDLYSPDNAFRVVTWNNSLKDGTYDYVCFIQLNPNTESDIHWFELNDQHKQISRPETRSLTMDNWFGCLYYTIVPFKHEKETHYALLGWEGNNNFSNKKIIESLHFNKKNEPQFGKSVFKTERLNKRRIVFEYSKEAYLMLRYNEELKQIIFNRLEPSKPELKGLYSFYQPTMIFDAYQVKKGEWVLVEDVNPRNKKNNKEFHNPEDLKKPKN